MSYYNRYNNNGRWYSSYNPYSNYTYDYSYNSDDDHSIQNEFRISAKKQSTLPFYLGNTIRDSASLASYNNCGSWHLKTLDEKK